MAISQSPNLVKCKHLLKTYNLGTVSSWKIFISSSFKIISSRSSWGSGCRVEAKLFSLHCRKKEGDFLSLKCPKIQLLLIWHIYQLTSVSLQKSISNTHQTTEILYNKMVDTISSEMSLWLYHRLVMEQEERTQHTQTSLKSTENNIFLNIFSFGICTIDANVWGNKVIKKVTEK